MQDRHFAARIQNNTTVPLEKKTNDFSMYDSFVLNGKAQNAGRNALNNSLTMNNQ